MASGIKKHDVAFMAQGVGTPPIGQITPDEIDRYEIYNVIKPLAADVLGTVDPGTVDDDFVIDQASLDYPRNLIVTAPGANDYGGTVTVNGKNQFGEVISETIGVGTASNGGTTGGTQIFATVTSASWVTGGGDNQGTVSLSVTLGTALNAAFGLPCKIASTADVKRYTWVDGGVAKPQDAPGTYVDAVNHSVTLPGDGAAADDLVIWVKSTYDASSDTAPRVSNL